MLIYLGTFLISTFFLNISGLFNKNKILENVFVIIAIITPCILASQRDLSIGTDTNGYVYGMYNLAVNSNSSLSEYLEIAPPWYAIPKTVIGYMTLTWTCAQFNNGFQLLLFMIELLSILPVYISIKKVSTTNHETLLGYTLYLLFFFNISLNAARQSIALGFYLLAFTCMTNREYKKSIIFSATAFMFHDTALIIFVVFIMHCLLIDNENSEMKQKKYEYFLVFASIIAVICFFPLVGMLIKTGIYSQGALYLANYKQFNFSFIKTALYGLVYLVIVLNKRFMVKTREEQFYMFIALLSVIWLQFGALITYADRLSWYLFFPTAFVYLPKIAKSRRNKIHKIRGLYTAILLFVFLAYWIVLYGILNEHCTVPYVSHKVEY